MSKLSLSVHSEFSINPLNIPVAEDVLKRGWDLLDGEVESMWVSAGTALGLYRGDGLIEGDTDIDVACIGFPGVEEIIDRQMIENNFKPLVSVHYEGRPMQKAYMLNGTIFDIYIHWQDGDKYVNYGQSGKQTMPVEIYDTLEDHYTPLGVYTFPGNIEKYLTTRYGEDWKTPRKSKAKYQAF